MIDFPRASTFVSAVFSFGSIGSKRPSVHARTTGTERNGTERGWDGTKGNGTERNISKLRVGSFAIPSFYAELQLQCVLIAG